MKIITANKVQHAQALAFCFFEGEENKEVKKLPHYSQAIQDLFLRKEFVGKSGQIARIQDLGKRQKLFLIGLGKRSEADLQGVRKAFGMLALRLKDAKCEDACLILPVLNSTKEVARACVEGIQLALFEFKKYKTKKEEKTLSLEHLILVSDNVRETEEGARLGHLIAGATNYTRSICNEPGNTATPSYLAEEAKRMAKEKKLSCTVLGRKELERHKMNSMLSVAKGSNEEPKLIVLEYDGGKETVCVVGKGVTFDSGGISIKPGNDMDKMKFDKSGACAVLGIMRAAAELRLPLKVVGIMACVENLPSGSAYKPGDVITAGNGKTIEVLNTDAEGRMILADALWYAETKHRPTAIIDLATLTGACVVALGDIYSGLMTNDSALSKQVLQAGEQSGDKVWELPLTKEYDEKVKSEVADIKNVGEPGGLAGTIAGASFLKNFISETKWAHVDIAGTAYNGRQKDYFCYGATGAGVRLVIQTLMNWKRT